VSSAYFQTFSIDVSPFFPRQALSIPEIEHRALFLLSQRIFTIHLLRVKCTDSYQYVLNSYLGHFLYSVVENHNRKFNENYANNILDSKAVGLLRKLENIKIGMSAGSSFEWWLKSFASNLGTNKKENAK